MKKIIFSRAPVRICDIGGWTDTWFYNTGAVFNIAVDLYSYVRIIENGTNQINIISENLNQSTIIKNVNNKIDYDGNLDLLKAAVKRMEINRGLDIFVRSEAPPGSGTGSSASIAVALIAALEHYSKVNLKKHEIAKLAHELEVKELKLESGVQDQYAAAYGGINFMEIKYPSVKISNITIDEYRLCELESQLILVYLGARSSNEMHKAVIENYENSQTGTIKALEIMKNCAFEMKKKINSADIKEIGDVIIKNWEAQKKLHPLMIDSRIRKLEKVAFENNAIGFKCNGAGGGGSVTILAGIGYEYSLKKKIMENGFLTILPIKLNFKGVQTWGSFKSRV